jgi:hypothetical protein
VPWTQQQTRYLLSKGSPLSEKKKAEVIGELHADPSIGHKAPGPAANAESRARYKSYRAKKGE